MFLLSSKAGGCGLNLIGGNRLVLFDPGMTNQFASLQWGKMITAECTLTLSLQCPVWSAHMKLCSLQPFTDPMHIACIEALRSASAIIERTCTWTALCMLLQSRLKEPPPSWCNPSFRSCRLESCHRQAGSCKGVARWAEEAGLCLQIHHHWQH